jgi:stearoyl-CoA desaturase (delta-9 desaturase)
VKRAAPRVEFRPTEHTVDLEMVTALLRNRFHVMKLYGNQVIKPVLRKELHGAAARRQLRRFRKWLTREDLLLGSEQRRALEEALRDTRALKVVVEYRDRLKALMRPAVNESDRLRRLQEWCAQAEATGIEALGEFARQLRGYRLRTA